MYYESGIERFLRSVISVIKTIAKSLQGSNYLMLLVITVMASGLSIYKNGGLPPNEKNIFEFFRNLIDKPDYLLVDSLAGLLCLVMIIPTSYLWWELRSTYYFYRHLPVLLLALVLLVFGFIFSSTLLTIVMLLSILVFVIWIFSKFR